LLMLKSIVAPALPS